MTTVVSESSAAATTGRNRSRIRTMVLYAAGFTVMTIGTTVTLLIAIVTLFQWRRFYSEVMAKSMARMALWLAGIRIVVHVAEEPRTPNATLSSTKRGSRAVFKSWMRKCLLYSPSGRVESKRGEGDRAETSPRSRFLKLRFSGNPTRKRGKIDLDSSLADASGYQKPMPHAKAESQNSRSTLLKKESEARLRDFRGGDGAGDVIASTVTAADHDQTKKLEEFKNGAVPQVVYIANHASTLDVFVLTALGLPNTRFFLSGHLRRKLPLGLLGYLAGVFWTVPQKYPEKRIRIFKRAERVLRRTGESVFLSPEGNKGRIGTIAPFNKGAFHLATQLSAPIVPLYIAIPRNINPGWGYEYRPGVVDVYLHPPIATEDWNVDDVIRHKDELHDYFVELQQSYEGSQ